MPQVVHVFFNFIILLLFVKSAMPAIEKFIEKFMKYSTYGIHCDN